MKFVGFMIMTLLVSKKAFAGSGCTGAKPEIQYQSSVIATELRRDYPNATEFKSAAVTGKEGTRHIFSFVVTSEGGETTQVVGTSVFAGKDCSEQNSFVSAVH